MQSHVDVILTPKQRSFALELAKGTAKTDAYIAAFGYKGKRARAENSARKLARDPRIAVFIESLSHRAIDLKGVQNQDIELGIAELAFSDIRQLFGPDDEFLPPPKWPASIARCVARYEEHVLPGGNILRRKISLWDKPSSLKLLAEIKAMLHGKPDSTQRAHFTIHLGGGARVPTAKFVKGLTLDAEGAKKAVRVTLPPMGTLARAAQGNVAVPQPVDSFVDNSAEMDLGPDMPMIPVADGGPRPLTGGGIKGEGGS